MSLPCLITTACHFPELAAAGGGIEVPPLPSAVTQGPARPDRATSGRTRRVWAKSAVGSSRRIIRGTARRNGSHQCMRGSKAEGPPPQPSLIEFRADFCLKGQG